jgi:hypothetical protein
MAEGRTSKDPVTTPSSAARARARQVERFNCVTDSNEIKGTAWADMDTDPNGEYVRHSDYEELSTELSAKDAEIERLRKWHVDVEEREAAVCPEDVGFDEYIRVLDRKLTTACADAIRELLNAFPAMPGESTEYQQGWVDACEGIRDSANAALESLLNKEKKDG